MIVIVVWCDCQRQLSHLILCAQPFLTRPFPAGGFPEHTSTVCFARPTPDSNDRSQEDIFKYAWYYVYNGLIGTGFMALG